MPNCVLTSAGLSFITCASNGGPLIALKYFLPVYDYRIDNNIHGRWTSTISLTSAALSGDSTPRGEIIYNINESLYTYGISNTDDFILYTGSETVNSATTTWVVSNTVQSKESQINLYNGRPLSTYISGTSIDSSASSNAFVISAASVVRGSNSVPDETSVSRDRYFKITDYYPVTSGTDLRGSWKCRLTKSIGSVKFNKIALYAVQLDSNGIETEAEPILFAQSMLSSPIIKTNFGSEGFDDIVIDVQIKIDSVANNFGNVFYSTSGDYWSRTPGGVYYSERVGIGVFADGVDIPKGKLEIKNKDNNTSADLPHIILTDKSNEEIYSGLHTSNTGDLELLIRNRKGLLPSATGKNYLGWEDKQWRKIFCGGTTEESYNFDLTVGQNSIKMGSSGINMDNMCINITSAESMSGSFVGGDVYRIDEPLILFTKTKSNNTNSLYLIAGAEDASANYILAEPKTGQRGSTHKNIKYYLNQNNYTPFGNSDITMIAKGGMWVLGDIKSISSTTYDLGSADKSWNHIYTRYISGPSNNAVMMAENLIPSVPNSWQIGFAGSRFQKGHFQELDSLSINVNTLTAEKIICDDLNVGERNEIPLNLSLSISDGIEFGWNGMGIAGLTLLGTSVSYSLFGDTIFLNGQIGFKVDVTKIPSNFVGYFEMGFIGNKEWLRPSDKQGITVGSAIFNKTSTSPSVNVDFGQEIMGYVTTRYNSNRLRIYIPGQKITTTSLNAAFVSFSVTYFRDTTIAKGS